jgi:hypothetical protein
MLTGLGGFLISFSLLHLGVSQMWLRYPVVILLAYCLFLLLLRLWLAFQRAQDRSNLELDFDPSGLADFNPSGLTNYDEAFRFSGTGGDAGGGGAGGSWGESVAASSSSPLASSPSASVSSSASVSGGSTTSSSGGLGLDIDLDSEGCLFILLAIAAIIAGLVAVFYVVYAAPALLAEILLDGVLLTGLYKRLKGIEQRHWLWSAVRRTLLPALLAALFFSLAGFAMQKAAPEARSVGEVWRHITKGER